MAPSTLEYPESLVLVLVFILLGVNFLIVLDVLAIHLLISFILKRLQLLLHDLTDLVENVFQKLVVDILVLVVGSLEQGVELLRVENLVLDNVRQKLFFEFLNTLLSLFLQARDFVVELEHLFVQLLFLAFLFLPVFILFLLVPILLENLSLVVLLLGTLSDIVVFLFEIHGVRIDLRYINVDLLNEILLFFVPAVSSILHVILVVLRLHLGVLFIILFTVLVLGSVFFRRGLLLG